MTSSRLYLPVYAVTLLVSAVLLFSVQPMFAKMILPLLGGSPNVWNTSMLFFQVMLLAGYAYAHLGARYLSLKAQMILQASLLAFFMIVLPLGIPEAWEPQAGQSPTLWQLGVMVLTVGGPFFVISASAPMLQRWFSRTPHKDAGNAYFLYGASNLGSVGALLSYPFLIEPLFDMRQQSAIWSAGYFILIGLTIFSGLLAWRFSDVKTKKRSKQKVAAISWRTRGLWMLLAFIPSSLMLGVTTLITTDVASFPLLWIIPLTLYISTFIIVFSRKQLVSLPAIFKIQSVLFIIYLGFLISPLDIRMCGLLLATSIHLALFFICALSCHMQLAQLKPEAGKLTEFYMFMSLGGALGGFFNAIIAPQIFLIPFEYAIALSGAFFMMHMADPAQSLSKARHKFSQFLKRKRKKKAERLDLIIFSIGTVFALIIYFDLPLLADYLLSVAVIFSIAYFAGRRWVFAILGTIVLMLFPDDDASNIGAKVIYRDRSFFGIIKVIDLKTENLRILAHGTTLHGIQKINGKDILKPFAYYYSASPIGDAFSYLGNLSGAQNLGVIGLGAGSVACYKKPERHFDFFEIDKSVVDIAENSSYFTYLSGCKNYSITEGDARLTIRKKPDRSYDMILLDAFSSDNIPIHLLTLEALQSYQSKLKKNGFIIAHISNRHIDLEPVLARAAQEMGLTALQKTDVVDKKENPDFYSSQCVILTSNPKQVAYFKSKGWKEAREQENVKLWTDGYHDIISVLNFTSQL